MERDYLTPSDLYRLICCAISQKHLNAAVDAFSRHPVSKTEMLEHFSTKFGLEIVWRDSEVALASPNATRKSYLPLDFSARKLGYQPQFSSLEGLEREMIAALRFFSKD